MGRWREIKRYFVNGLIIVAPLLVTLLVVKVMYDWLLIYINPIVFSTQLTRYTADIELVAQFIAGALVVFAITLVGYTAKTRRGRKVLERFGRVMDVIPVVRSVYGGVREVANALIEQETRFKRTVLIEYPREDLYRLGFVTGETPDGIDDKIGDGADTVNVFLPDSPNPTMGRLVVAHPDEITETDLSVKEGIRFLLSTGITTDPDELEEKNIRLP